MNRPFGEINTASTGFSPEKKKGGNNIGILKTSKYQVTGAGVTPEKTRAGVPPNVDEMIKDLEMRDAGTETEKVSEMEIEEMTAEEKKTEEEEEGDETAKTVGEDDAKKSDTEETDNEKSASDEVVNVEEGGNGKTTDSGEERKNEMRARLAAKMSAVRSGGSTQGAKDKRWTQTTLTTAPTAGGETPQHKLYVLVEAPLLKGSSKMGRAADIIVTTAKQLHDTFKNGGELLSLSTKKRQKSFTKNSPPPNDPIEIRKFIHGESIEAPIQVCIKPKLNNRKEKLTFTLRLATPIEFNDASPEWQSLIYRLGMDHEIYISQKKLQCGFSAFKWMILHWPMEWTEDDSTTVVQAALDVALKEDGIASGSGTVGFDAEIPQVEINVVFRYPPGVSTYTVKTHYPSSKMIAVIECAAEDVPKIERVEKRLKAALRTYVRHADLRQIVEHKSLNPKQQKVAITRIVNHRMAHDSTCYITLNGWLPGGSLDHQFRILINGDPTRVLNTSARKILMGLELPGTGPEDRSVFMALMQIDDEVIAVVPSQAEYKEAALNVVLSPPGWMMFRLMKLYKPSDQNLDSVLTKVFLPDAIQTAINFAEWNEDTQMLHLLDNSNEYEGLSGEELAIVNLEWVQRDQAMQQSFDNVRPQIDVGRHFALDDSSLKTNDFNQNRRTESDAFSLSTASTMKRDQYRQYLNSARVEENDEADMPASTAASPDPDAPPADSAVVGQMS